MRVGAQPARLASASSTALTVLIPEGLEGGSTADPHRRAAGRNARSSRSARRSSTGVHHVDSPAYDRHGNLYVTFSGSRGQQAPVVDLRRPAGRHARAVRHRRAEPDVAGLRSRRAPLRVEPLRRQRLSRRGRTAAPSLYASDLGVACGLAFGARRRALRRRSLRLDPARRADGRAHAFATLPPSVAAFHLAFGPDGHLYVTAPTLGTHDPSIASPPSGDAVPWSAGFGRPQGLAFDAAGKLFVVDALAGIERALSHPPRRAARAGADAVGRRADRPRLRSARRHRARRRAKWSIASRRPARPAAASVTPQIGNRATYLAASHRLRLQRLQSST